MTKHKYWGETPSIDEVESYFDTFQGYEVKWVDEHGFKRTSTIHVDDFQEAREKLKMTDDLETESEFHEVFKYIIAQRVKTLLMEDW